MLVIFDFDGTLADTWDLLAGELLAGATRFRYKQIDRAELEHLRRLETRAVFRALGVPWWRLPRLVAHLRSRAAALACDIKLFPGMRDVVVALGDAGHTLAVASTNSEATVRAVLGDELSSRFQYFACDSALFGKAAKFRKLRRQAGVAASAVVSVGDETRDLDAAAAAGIAGIAVEWGYNDPALLRRLAPDRTAASPADLLDMLMRYAAHGRLGES